MRGRDVLDAATSEAELQSTILQMAKLGGWLVYHTHDSRRSNEGWPDLVLCRPPQLLIVELKREGKDPTIDQERWLEALARCGIDVAVWRPSDMDTIEAKLLGRPELVGAERRICPACNGARRNPDGSCVPCGGNGVLST